MKYRFVCLLLIFLLPILALAEDPLLGRVTKNMTIRKTKSTSGIKLGSVAEGEEVYVLSMEDKWLKIQKDDVTGYILSKNVTDFSSAVPHDDAAEAVFSGIAGGDLTLRAKKSKSAQKLQGYLEGETVYITELGKEWFSVVKNGVHGYVLRDGIVAITSLREGVSVPEAYVTGPLFQAVYSARADVNLGIRRNPREDAEQIGMIPENEYADVMYQEDGWAYVQRKGVSGFVKASHLRYYKRYDPFGPLVPNVQVCPYAGMVLRDVPLYDAETGELLRVLPAGAVVGISRQETDGSLLLPYQRKTGRITDPSALALDSAIAWDEADPGDMLAVFSTFYPEQPVSAAEQGRLFNIEEGVRRIDGTVIHVDETFSFNELCAPYTSGNGYQEGPIINYVSSKKTGYGGGICQVSTTLYDAVLQIPVDIVKQQVHSAYGIFYAPLDMDAAVGAGNLDLRLHNVLPYDIRMTLLNVRGVLTVRIWRVEL